MRYHRNPAANKDEIVQLLKKLLANTYLLYIQTQGAHWNVVGSNFPQLHTLFQTQYEELTLATDLLAEHIRTYGDVAPASAGEFLKLATFKESRFTGSEEHSEYLYSQEKAGRFKESHSLQWADVDSEFLISMLIDQHRATIEVATQLGAITGNALHTQNLAADRIEAHEKAVWMLESTLNKGSSRRRNPYWY